MADLAFNIHRECPESSNVKAFSYDLKNRVLRVRFRSFDGHYDYEGVEPEVAAAGLIAESAGKFIGDIKKGAYLCTKHEPKASTQG